MFTKFTEVLGIWMRFQCAYLCSGNGIVERSHHAIQCIAVRPQCSIMEAVYWYRVTSKDDTTFFTTPANSIHMYHAHIKDIDVAPPLEHTNPAIYKEMQYVLCISKKKQWQGSTTKIQFSSVEHHAISETSAHNRDLLSWEMTAVISHLRAIQIHRSFSVLGQTIHQWNQKKQIQLPFLCYLYDQEIRDEYRREEVLPHVAKWAYIWLVCKMNGGLEKKKKIYGCLNTLI